MKPSKPIATVWARDASTPTAASVDSSLADSAEVACSEVNVEVVVRSSVRVSFGAFSSVDHPVLLHFLIESNAAEPQRPCRHGPVVAVRAERLLQNVTLAVGDTVAKGLASV